MSRFRKLGLACSILILGTIWLSACPMQTPSPGGGTTGSDTNGDVSNSALSFAGSVSGVASTASSTDAASAGANARRKLTDRSLAGQFGSGAAGWLEDLGGARLRDASGNEYPNFPVRSDGSFDMGQLPVGVDFVLKIDTDGDGKADMQSIINIPKDATGEGGSLNNTNVDPLSTLVLAKLRQLLAAHGIRPRDMGISPSALIQRIRDAYEHMFDESGIDNRILLSELASLSEEQLAALFEQVIPVAARRGMQMAEGNIVLANAKDVEGVVKAVAQILVQGGFVIADDPGGIDLAFLAGLPNVNPMTFSDFHKGSGPGGPPPGSPPPSFAEPTLYVSDLGEADRNFANNKDEAKARDGGGGPMFGEHVLKKMAAAFLANKTITLGELHRIVVDLHKGMGVRLSYTRWNGPDQPPAQVFETTDGGGLSINMDEFFNQLNSVPLDNPDPDQFARHEAEVRQTLVDFLAGTKEPSFERLFEGVLTDRIASAQNMADHLRNARAHLPFSRSGPASFFVLATADSFMDAHAQPVTVNVETDASGRVAKVTYDATGNGKFYVGFGPMTDTGMMVELINRRNGHGLHDNEGRFLQLDIAGGNVFQPVGGTSFMDTFSESGSHFPGAPALRVPNRDFDPDQPPDPEINPPAIETYVLMTEHGPNGKPVRVEYANGVATFNENGRYYMMFDEQTDTNGLFALITESGEVLEATPGDYTSRVLVAATSVQGASLAPETFRNFFGKDAPNIGYDPTGAPYYDDINGNGAPDAGEPSFDFRDFLFDANDWRSTRVDHYYRRADTNGFFQPQEVDWGSNTPKLQNGVDLVPRTLKPRLNAFRFGRPNLTINLLTAFSPPEFFNGTVGLNADTRVNPFMALALLNLVFDGIHNVKANVDWDGPGPMPEHQELVEAFFFVLPIGDPVQLIVQGFEEFAR